MRDVRNAAGQRRETPYGVLYSPKTFGLQVLVLVGAFAGGPVIGWLTARTGRSVFDRGGDSLCPADVDLLFRIRPLVRQARVYRIPRYWQARIVVSFRRCLREKKAKQAKRHSADRGETRRNDSSRAEGRIVFSDVRITAL